MATQDFIVKYDGLAVAEGRIPVRDLAPSLLALGELFQRANELTQPGAPAVNLEVRAFDNGSFEAALSAVTKEAVDFLTSDPVVALGILMSLVTDAGTSVFAALKVLRGRIVRQEQLRDGTTRFEDNHGNVFIGSNITVNVLNDRFARDAAAAAIEPLRKEGVDEIRFERADEEPLIIDEAVVETIDRWAEEEAEEAEPEPIIDQSMEAVVLPLQPTLDPRYMGRFQIAGTDQIIRATIVDRAYWQRIWNHEEYFFEGDSMRVRLRMRQWAPETRKPTEWTIEEVIRHSHPEGRRMPLPFPEDEEGGT